MDQDKAHRRREQHRDAEELRRLAEEVVEWLLEYQRRKAQGDPSAEDFLMAHLGPERRPRATTTVYDAAGRRLERIEHSPSCIPSRSEL